MAKTRVLRMLAAMALAVAAACVFSGAALAADITVWGAQTYLSEESTTEDTSLNLVFASGTAGKTMFLTVKDGDTALAKNLPHTLGEGAEAGEASADVFRVNFPGGVSEDKLRNGSYSVEACSDRAGTQIYRGTVYGVWASLGGSGKTPLIGTRTAAEGESFNFVPPNVISHGDAVYKLASDTPEMNGMLAYYSYEEFDSSGSVDAQVNYVDKDGSILKVETFPVSTDGASATHSIPATIDVEGKRYRTLAYADEATATYPTQTTFTVPCLNMGGAAYLAVIKMVDEEGNVIATDTVNVNGKFTYTVPNVIYKRELVNDETRVVEYDLDDEGVCRLDSDADISFVVNGKREITFNYKRQELDAGQIAVTYNQIDGRDNPDLAGRLMGTQTKTVTQENPTATPDQQIQVKGETFTLVSAASDYAYTYGSGEIPVIDAYYVPDGYTAPEPYTVTVDYVNYANDEVVRSETFESNNDDPIVKISAPAEFSDSGIDYVRLAGQTGITHNFYSGMKTYKVYYRDVNDDLSKNVVIERTRVVVRQVTTTTTRPGTGGTGTAQGTATPTVSLNPGVGYNAIGGQGNGALVNDRGQDTNTERIGDDQTPLAQSDGTTTSAPTEEGGLMVGGIAAAIVAAIAVIAALIWWFMVGRRRNEEEANEQ